MNQFLLSTIAFSTYALTTVTTPLFAQDLRSKIQDAFTQFQNQESLRNGLSSLIVFDGKTGQTVFAANENIGLATASTMKVITSATALDFLGKNFQFKTTLYYTGEIDENGVLNGSIIVTGTGDPTLGSARYPETQATTILNKWLTAIQNAGIKGINGAIIADDRLYNGNQLPGGWIWTDMGNYYGAGISSLNWCENAFGINFTPSNKIGAKAEILSYTAQVPYLEIINETTTGKSGSGDNVYAYAAPYSTKIFVRGSYGQDLKKTIELSSPDPAYDLAYQLNEVLNNNGIVASERPATGTKMDSVDVSKKQTLDIHLSPTLDKIVYWFNQKSINLYGEALLKAIAYTTAGKTGTDDGAYYIQKYWNAKLGIKSSELNSMDGSGLSPQNRVTTAAMNKIMQYAQKQSWYPAFYESLPTYNNMKMKSGTIGGVLGYTGVHTNKTGQSFTYTLLVNNYAGPASSMRQQMFKLLDVLK
ncbi:D-alanyl-D-alanine carboxypeptidase/D-alanyl-D-alanine endopeptidase [Sphingobacterium siyangense]|jgi:D-alanyl-D-alanine carboxypeptidase/D-alanyl-D-alanine-endopeptidase (penicillin-binding protein 4)|uniref:D-alanyl-D-alanine carboxypeptidase/D-alanyl-D-alanine endopeptidase n=1 Tax=Sphingobacterium siyangense TaxID=459529 RepID=UPI0028B1A47F|nr:D-alanyl-D-alanine carboxypeptidase/D-alanyl-D-alanine-endopeptidase [Sphingobacterium siyangense]